MGVALPPAEKIVDALWVDDDHVWLWDKSRQWVPPFRRDSVRVATSWLANRCGRRRVGLLGATSLSRIGSQSSSFVGRSKPEPAILDVQQRRRRGRARLRFPPAG